MTEHPDDKIYYREAEEGSYTCCGGRDGHKIGCEFDDEPDDLPADPDDTEDEDADEWLEDD